MIRTVAVLLLACALPLLSQQISSPTNYVQQSFNVLEYDAVISFPQPSTREIIGQNKIIVRWLEDVQAASLPIHLRALTIDSATRGEESLTVIPRGSVEDDTFHLAVALNATVSTGSVDTITVYYHGIMTNEGGSTKWGGVTYEDQVLYAMGVGFSNNYVSGTQHWLPCYDHPSDKARLKLAFRVPTGMNVASVGRRVAINDLGNGTTEYLWQEDHEIATYLMTFAVGPLVESSLAGHPTIPHVAYTLARDTTSSRISYRLVPQMTQVLESLFGPYPFDKVGFVNTQKGAMEHQTMISFPISLAQRKDTVNTTAAHEIAHQWWGDLVTSIDLRHAWLTESFATFSEGLWVEHLQGWDTYLLSMTNGAVSYIKDISVKEGVFALVDFPREAPSSNYPQTIYRKGANVLAMARALTEDDDVFFGALRSYLQTFAEGTASTTDMKEALRPALGDRTETFFQEWIYGVGWPQLTIHLRPENGSGWVVDIAQVQNAQHSSWPEVFTTLPLNIVYIDRDGKAVDTVIVMTGSDISLEIGSPEGFGVNDGQKCRTLTEVVEVTTIMDPSIDNTRIDVMPNPAHSSISIIRENVYSTSRIDIMDSTGRVVATTIMHDGDVSVLMNVAKLASGRYMVRVMSEWAVTALPLLIQH